jgi:hypothetical protein
MPDKFPDALMLPVTLKRGARLSDRVASLVEVAEEMLGIDPRSANPDRAWCRQQPHQRVFVTRDPADTILFGRDSSRAGQPRYRWVKQSDGVEFGWLVEGGGDVG